MNRELIYDILRVTLADGKVDSYGALQEVSAEDWQWMYDLLDKHSVTPLVSDVIPKLPAEMRPPEDIMAKFIEDQEVCKQNYTKMGKLVASLDKLLSVSKVKCLLLKGFNTAAYYPKPYLRKFVDLDLYAPRKFAAVDAVFLEHGFEVEDDLYKRSYVEINGILVENHKRLLDSRGRKRQEERDEELKTIAGSQLLRSDKMGLQYPVPKLAILFFLNHTMSHFVAEGMSFKYLVDWIFFLRKEKVAIGSEEVRHLILKHDLLEFAATLTLMCVKHLGLAVSEIPWYLQVRIKAVEPDVEARFVEDLFRPQEPVQDMGFFKNRIAVLRRMIDTSWKPKVFLEENPVSFVASKIVPILFGDPCDAD